MAVNIPGYPGQRLRMPTNGGVTSLPDGGYDGGGINPGGGFTPIPSTPVPAPGGITPPNGPMPTVPPGGIPSTPVPAPSMGPTEANPLAPLNNYQAQQQTGSYQAPQFQG